MIEDVYLRVATILGVLHPDAHGLAFGNYFVADLLGRAIGSVSLNVFRLTRAG